MSSKSPLIARLPLGRGRLIWDRNPESAARTLGEAIFATNLRATKFDGDGKLVHEYDLGSGLVTNVGVLAMANDFAWSASLNLATLALANYHASGTGATAAAATDIALQTSAGPSPVAGTQTLVSAANLQKYQSVATLAYTGSPDWMPSAILAGFGLVLFALAGRRVIRRVGR